jgi:cytochrome c oxidase assembly protein subunit 15
VSSGQQAQPWRLRVLQANLTAQAGIIVTGALVRVTGSGLGCPTWPECVPGSLTPTADQTEQWHKWVEFGNRTLTGVLAIVAVATIVAMRGQRRALLLLSWGTLLGIAGQAVLGGISVLLNLNPYIVAAHFLLSIGLVAVAATLLWRFRSGDRGAPTVVPAVAAAIRGHTWLGLSVIVLGTLVTGAGPHAGDSSDVPRIPIDPRVAAWLHADAVLLFIGLTIGISIALSASNAPLGPRRAALWVITVAAGQGAVGYLQWFTGLPWLLVAVHVLGAVLLWITVVRLRLAALG